MPYMCDAQSEPNHSLRSEATPRMTIYSVRLGEPQSLAKSYGMT